MVLVVRSPEVNNSACVRSKAIGRASAASVSQDGQRIVSHAVATECLPKGGWQSFRILLTALMCTECLFGQATPNAPFQIRIQTGTAISTMDNGGTLTVTAPGPGQAALSLITFTNTGSRAVTIVDRPRIIGSADFSVSPSDVPPVLQPADTLTVQVQFRPATSARLTGQLLFSFSIAAPAGSTSGNVVLNLVGTSPDPVFAYLPPDANVTPVSPGGSILFPSTAVGATSTTTVVLANRGTATFALDSVGSSGPSYTVSGLPLLPSTIEPGRDLRFNVRFAPLQPGGARGQLSLGIGGQTLSFTLDGTATAPQYTYEVIRDQTPAPIQPAQTISFPETRTGSSSRVLVRFTNRGSAEGRITAINAAGAGYQVTDVPALPLTLPAGRSAEFFVTFAPSQPGQLTGRLRIGDEFFELSGTSLGVRLTYAYSLANIRTAVAAGESVILPATDVGRLASTLVSISNTGTVAATIGSIGLGSTSAVFSITELPQLPLTLNPGEEVSFLITFAPNARGSASATLRIDNDSLTLSGISNGAVPVPAYRIETSDAVQPLSQPAITLTLNAAYPLPLNGALTILGDSDTGPADPAVQFAAGGRTMNFRIPANTTQALFGTFGQQVRMQTGTVAGILRVVPTFATEAGLSLTPVVADELRIEVAESVPKLLSVQAATTDTSIAVQITGFSTTKTLREVEFQFAVVSGITASETRFTVNVESAFSGWYQSVQSRQFGSQFTATMPFTLQRTGSASGTAAQAIQSVSVRLINERGSSETVTVPAGR